MKTLSFLIIFVLLSFDALAITAGDPSGTACPPLPPEQTDQVCRTQVRVVCPECVGGSKYVTVEAPTHEELFQKYLIAGGAPDPSYYYLQSCVAGPPTTNGVPPLTYVNVDTTCQIFYGNGNGGDDTFTSHCGKGYTCPADYEFDLETRMCISTETTLCPLICPPHKHPSGLPPQQCVDDDPPDCPSLGPHMINDPADPYNCISEPPVDCPSGQHHVDDWTCAPDGGTDPPPDGGTDPPPDGGTDPPPDGGTDPPPDGGTDPPPDGGTDPPPDGGTDPPPDGGTDPPPSDGQCGSFACETTLLGVVGALQSILSSVNSTRSVELSGLLAEAKTGNAKTAAIHAIAEQALEYVVDIIANQAKDGVIQTDMAKKLGDLTLELGKIQTKQDTALQAMTDKANETLSKLEDLKAKQDQSLAKQDLTNDSLLDLRDKSALSLEKQIAANEKLDMIKDKLSQSKDIQDGMSTKLDKLSWLEKLGKLDLIADILGLMNDIWDWFRSVPENIAQIPLKLEQLPQKIKENLDFCADHPDWLFCPSPDEPPEIDPQPLDTQDIDVDVSPMISAAGSCPADRVATLSNGLQLSFTFSYICQFAENLRFLVIALSYLAAARILIGSNSGT